MIYFNNDYSEGCHPKVMEALAATNLEQTPGYGEDEYCRSAADKIRMLCKQDDLDIHFLAGGTQTNMTVISAALRPHQGVLCADSGHIHVHETGAVEATGHKVLAQPSLDGKITAKQIAQAVIAHRTDSSMEHMVQPKMVYISHPSEMGTLYTKAELREISDVCREMGLYLFLDGARLGYGMVSEGSDVDFSDLARLCDVFYIGGTKVGALFGEAVVICNPSLKEDFRYHVKQRGGMLAKGRLLGVQFDVLFSDELYLTIARHAVRLAADIRRTLSDLEVTYLVPGTTNQIFPILPDTVISALEEKYVFCPMGRVDQQHSAIRICTSWASNEDAVKELCEDLKQRIFTTRSLDK